MSYTAYNGLWVTEHRKTGKMENKDSIMFSHPTFCQERTCGVCKKCYSKRLSAYRPMLHRLQVNNTKCLSSPDFEPCQIRTIDNTLRWASTGELDNDQMFINICKMAAHNPDIIHQLWTKKDGIVMRNKNLIPDNLVIVWSASKIDVPRPFVPTGGYKIGFFVYSDESLIPKGVFHCQKKCSDCGFCYKKDSSGIVGEVIR